MSDFPTSAKVVVIGAGIVGNCLVGHLARLGWTDLVLLDKGPLPNPGGSTGHASNFIFPVDHNKEMALLGEQSANQYRDLNLSVDSGGIEVARTQERMDELQRRMTSATAWGIEAHLLDPAQVKELVPFINEDVILGGFYCPTVSVVDSLETGTVMRKEAIEKAGCQVFANTEVLDILTDDTPRPNGRRKVTGVVTDKGTIDAEYVVVACGVWSNQIAYMADTYIPLVPAVHQMADVGHLVHGRDERDVGVGHVGDLVRPHTAGDDDVLGVDRALVGNDTGDLAPTVRTRRVVGEDVEHLGVGEDLATGLLDGFLAHHGAGLEGVDHRDGRAVEAAEDDVFVDERHELFDLRGVKQVSLDAPRCGGGHPALEFVHALLGPGDLDAAGIDREVQVAVLVGGLLTEQRHFLVVVDREDEVRRMAGRAARVGQRALVQQDEVGPAEAGQMAHQAVADDAGADDDDLGGSREVAHVGSPQCCCDAVSGVGDALGARNAVA